MYALPLAVCQMTKMDCNHILLNVCYTKNKILSNNKTTIKQLYKLKVLKALAEKLKLT